MARYCYMDVPNKEDIRQELLKEKFNIELNIINIPQKEFKSTVYNLLSGPTPPDFVENMRPDYGLDNLTENECLLGFTDEDLKKHLPDYLNFYNSDMWIEVKNQIRHSDNKIYYLPGKRPKKMRTAWMYRRDIFEKYNLSFPKNPEEFMEVCRILKEKEGKIPFLLHDPVSLNPLYAFTMFQMYGILEVLPREFSCVDPFTDKFYAYVFLENHSREAITFVNKFIKAGYMWKDFITGTEKDIMKFREDGNGFIMLGYPDKAIEHNKFASKIYPHADWTWSREMPSAFSDRTYFTRCPYHNPEGPAISSRVSQEKLERILAYINWSCTNEGLAFHTFGVEGKTAQRKNGKWLFLDHMQSPANPMGVKMGVYGKAMAGGFCSGFMSLHPDYDELYNPVFDELADAFIGKPNYYSFKVPVYQFTKEEKVRLTTLVPVIKELTTDYYLKFAADVLDPSNNTHWNTFKAALNQGGLQEFIKIKTEAYDRAHS